MSTSALVTVGQLDSFPEDGNKYELDRGELIVTNRPGLNHELVKSRVLEILVDYKRASGAGQFFCETGYLLGRDPDVLLIPDISFVITKRMETAEQQDTLESPDVCIEIVSSETAKRLDRKIDLYFATGARSVWILYPDTEKVHVFSGPDSVRILRTDDVLRVPDVLPDFAVPVREFFAT